MSLTTATELAPLVDKEIIQSIYRVGPSPRLIAADLQISFDEVRIRLRNPSAKTVYYDSVSRIEKSIKRFTGNISVLAKIFEVDRYMVQAWVQDNPRLSRAHNDFKEGLIDAAEQVVYFALQNRERWAADLVLRTLGARRGWIEPKVIVDLERELDRLGMNSNTVIEEVSDMMMEAQNQQIESEI